MDTSKDQWWAKHNASNMVEVQSMDEFLGELKRCGEGKLVIVDFYARWCAACRALHPKLCKIAEANSADVVVIKIEFDDNKDLCRGMGVKVLPYFQLYKGSLGKVAGFSASISKVGRIREAIEEHRPGGCLRQGRGRGHGMARGRGPGQERERGRGARGRSRAGARAMMQTNFFFFILFPRRSSVDARAFDRVKCDASLYKMTRVLTRL